MMWNKWAQTLLVPLVIHRSWGCSPNGLRSVTVVMNRQTEHACYGLQVGQKQIDCLEQALSNLSGREWEVSMSSLRFGPLPSLHLDGAGSGLTYLGCGPCDGVWWRGFWYPGGGSHPLLAVELFENNCVWVLSFPKRCNQGFLSCGCDTVSFGNHFFTSTFPHSALLNLVASFWSAVDDHPTHAQPIAALWPFSGPHPWYIQAPLTLPYKLMLFWSSQTFLYSPAAYPILAFFMDQWTLEYQCSSFCQNVRNC